MPLSRRTVLGSLALGVPLGLAGCDADPPRVPNDPSPSAMPTDNPFGLPEDGQIEAVVFDGGYGVDYVNRAVETLTERRPKVRATVTGSTAVADDLKQRFTDNNPPDLVDDAGPSALAMTSILPLLDDLTTLTQSQTLDGPKVADVLIPGALEAGTYDGKLAAIGYALTTYGLWYSASLFRARGWTLPRTWAEALQLGAKARAAGKYLFCWGRESATYFAELAVASAIKDGGQQVRLDLENLTADCWSAAPVQRSLSALQQLVEAGYVKPGGSQLGYLAAQTQWGNAQDTLLYPAGSWIANEMSDRLRSGFELTVAPVPTASTTPALPYAAVHSQPTELFVVPTRARNTAGGKELLRVMLSRTAAAHFARTRQAPTVVKDSVPADGFGSTALVSQMAALAGAGANTFGWRFTTTYGLTAGQSTWWNSFLEGRIGTATLTTRLQELTDQVREDPSVHKVTVR